MTGQPTYIELGVPDADAARTFYGALLGWQPSGTDGPGDVSTSTLHIGIHTEDPSAELLVFFAVDDLDAALEQMKELGGSQDGEARADPAFGRFAICSDNQGVRFALHQRDAG